MPRSTFRPEVQSLFAALHMEREATQAQHFELRRRIAMKDYDGAIALLNEIFEQDAEALKILSRASYLEIEAAKRLLENNNRENDSK